MGGLLAAEDVAYATTGPARSTLRRVPRTSLAVRAPAQETALEQLGAVAASAALLGKGNLTRPKNTGGAGGDWQNEAWYFYDTCGEFRFGINWKAQALSRCTLIIEEKTDEGWERLADRSAPEWQALDQLFGGEAGQSQALRTFGLHIGVPGETYLVGEVLDDNGNPDPAGTDQWHLYSNEEFKPKGAEGETYELDRGDGKKRTVTAGEEPGDAWVIRLWRSHPRRWVEADSPARASLPILREVENIGKRIAAEIDSRLAGAGILLLPLEASSIGTNSATAGGTVETEGEPDNPEPPTAQAVVNKLLTDLMESMVTPISNRDHPAAVVPHLLQIPGQWLDKVKHLTLGGSLDEHQLTLRTEGLKRLAVSADIPAEVIMGIGDVNHWGAWQLEESAIKMHVEPDGEVFTSGLNERWLPIAVAAVGGQPNPNRRIGLDTADLRLRPDRTAQAQWLYEHFEIDGEALRRELGIEGEAPDPTELQDALLRKLAAEGLATPEVVVWAIQALISGQPPGPVPLPTPAEVQAGEGNKKAIEQGGGNNPDKSPPADTGPETPAAPAQAASGTHTPAEAAVFAAAELLVERAVERAHNRARQRGKHRAQPTDAQLTEDLRGAWDNAPRTAAHLGLDPDWFTVRLDTYARGLLTTGEDHQPQVLEQVLGS